MTLLYSSRIPALRRIVRLAKEQLAPDANVQHPNMLTGPTASRGLRKLAPPSDRHLEKEQPRRGRHAAAKAGAFQVFLRVADASDQLKGTC